MTDLNPRVPGGELAERWVCGGAMYLDCEEIVEVGHHVAQGDFLDPELGHLWAVELQLAMASKAVTPVTLHYALESITNRLSTIDIVELQTLYGEAFLHPRLNSVLAHAGIVHSQGVKMQKIKNLQEMVRDQVTAPKKSWRERYETSV